MTYYIAFKGHQIKYQRTKGMPSYLIDNQLVALAGHSWNETLSLANALGIPFTGNIRMGTDRKELLKRGWFVTPLLQDTIPQYWEKE